MRSAGSGATDAALPSWQLWHSLPCRQPPSQNRSRSRSFSSSPSKCSLCRRRRLIGVRRSIRSSVPLKPRRASSRRIVSKRSLESFHRKVCKPAQFHDTLDRDAHYNLPPEAGQSRHIDHTQPQVEAVILGPVLRRSYLIFTDADFHSRVHKLHQLNSNLHRRFDKFSDHLSCNW